MKNTKAKLMILVPLMMLGGFSAAWAVDMGSDSGNDSDFGLPDFSHTYGYDSRPDIRLHSTPAVNAAPKKQSFKDFKKKLKNKFSTKTKSGTKYGLQRYTKPSGKKRYGLGLKRKLKDGGKHGVVVHKSGANYELQTDRSKYYLGVDQRKQSSQSTADSTYLFFGLKIRW